MEANKLVAVKKSKKEEPKKFFVKAKKITHLHLQEKSLTKINKVESSHLEVFYLFNNKINNIENLDKLPNLTSLYLQRNKIERIENLKYLKNLKRLYIGHNCIRVLEGLEQLTKLEELHIEKQNLQPGDCFCFDPRTIHSISGSLRVLNISGNKITTMTYLAPLIYLRLLDISYNELECIKEVCDVLQYWNHLKSASFIGNPLAKKHRYKENVIASCYFIESLDGKKVSDTTRTFMKRFEQERLTNKSKPSTNLADIIPGVPKNYSHTLQKAVSASLLRNKLDEISFDETPTQYIPWKALPAKTAVKRRIPKLTLSSRNQNYKGVVINNFP